MFSVRYVLNPYMYIYICVCVCVCVYIMQICVFRKVMAFWYSKIQCPKFSRLLRKNIMFEIYNNFMLTFKHSNTLTNQLTTCSRILLEKLTFSLLTKKLSVFKATRRFITSFTTVRKLSCPEPYKFHPISLSPVLILSYHICRKLPSRLFQ